MHIIRMRMTSTNYTAALMLVLTGCVAPGPRSGDTVVTPGGGPAMDTISYLALGDSYTIGESVPEAERWPVQLVSLLRGRGIAAAEPTIIARTGWTTDELAAQLDVVRLRVPFSLVSLLIGVNNQYRGRDPEQYRAEFRSLLQRAIGFAGSDPGRVIVVSIPDWGVTPYAEGRDRGRIAAEIDRFNAINREETAALGARYVDITPGSRLAATNRALTAGDGLHPSGAMYLEWARAALPHALAAIGRDRGN